MYVELGRLMQQEFDTKERCLHWYKCKQLGLKNSLKLIYKEKKSMMIKTPITNEITVVHGKPKEIEWLHLELLKSDSFSYKQE